ncbi:unnamed protein product, partial [marine sediment metagenome]
MRSALKSNPFYERCKERVERLLAKAREVYADGKLTPEDIEALVRMVVKEAAAIVKDIDAQEGDRKQLFTDICVACWEDLGEPMRLIPDVSWIPGDWIEKGLEEKVVDPAIKTGVEFAAGVAYELLSK